MNLKPISNFILVEPEAEKEYSSGGLFIPQTARENEGVAKVLAVPDVFDLPDGNTRPMRVSVGDKVVYDIFSGVKTKVDGRDCLWLREQHIYSKLV